MIQFIREHWVQYLVGATVAALLGLGLSFFLGSIWSTPESVRAERAEAEQQKDEELGEIEFEMRDASEDDR